MYNKALGVTVDVHLSTTIIVTIYLAGIKISCNRGIKTGTTEYPRALSLVCFCLSTPLSQTYRIRLSLLLGMGCVGTLTTDYQKNTIISIWSIWSIVTIGLNEKLPLCTQTMSIYSNVVQQLTGVGGIEWIIIIIIFLALIFGSKKLPEVARGIGKAASEFEKAKIQMRREMEMAKIQSQDIVPNPNPDREKLEDIAEILGIDYSNKGDNELRMAIDSEIRKSSK